MQRSYPQYLRGKYLSNYCSQFVLLCIYTEWLLWKHALWDIPFLQEGRIYMIKSGGMLSAHSALHNTTYMSIFLFFPVSITPVDDFTEKVFCWMGLTAFYIPPIFPVFTALESNQNSFALLLAVCLIFFLTHLSFSNFFLCSED